MLFCGPLSTALRNCLDIVIVPSNVLSTWVWPPLVASGLIHPSTSDLKVLPFCGRCRASETSRSKSIVMEADLPPGKAPFQLLTMAVGPSTPSALPLSTALRDYLDIVIVPSIVLIT